MAVSDLEELRTSRILRDGDVISLDLHSTSSPFRRRDLFEQ